MIYFLIFLLLLSLAIKYDFKVGSDFSRKWYIIVLVIFTLFAGLRYKVGGDTQSYFDRYDNIKGLGSTTLDELIAGQHAFLWNLFESSMKSISNDFLFLQLVHAAFVNITIFWFIKKYSKFRFTSLLVYYIFAYLYFNMEIMKESIAICFFLLAYPYFEKKNWVKYYSFAIVAFLFHTSAVITLLFPLLSVFKYNVRNLIFVATLFLVFIAILATNQEFTNLLLVTETIENKFNIYSEYSLNINGKIYILGSFIIIPLYLMRINKNASNYKHVLFERMYIIYFMIAISYVIFSGFSRFVNYMTPFMVVYFAEVLNNIYTNRRYRNVKRTFVGCVFLIVSVPKILYYTADTSKFYPNTNKFNLYFPYSSVFEKEEYEFRSVIFNEGMREAANK